MAEKQDTRARSDGKHGRKRAFAAFRILRFEDTDGISDWDPQTTRLARLAGAEEALIRG
jgi:hypothetical protein